MITRTIPLVAQQCMGTEQNDGQDDICFGVPCRLPDQPQSSLQTCEAVHQCRRGEMRSEHRSLSDPAAHRLEQLQWYPHCRKNPVGRIPAGLSQLRVPDFVTVLISRHQGLNAKYYCSSRHQADVCPVEATYIHRLHGLSSVIDAGALQSRLTLAELPAGLEMLPPLRKRC